MTFPPDLFTCLASDMLASILLQAALRTVRTVRTVNVTNLDGNNHDPRRRRGTFRKGDAETIGEIRFDPLASQFDFTLCRKRRHQENEGIGARRVRTHSQCEAAQIRRRGERHAQAREAAQHIDRMAR